MDVNEDTGSCEYEFISDRHLSNTGEHDSRKSQESVINII